MTGYKNILIGLSSDSGHGKILEDGFAFANFMKSDLDTIHISDPLQDPIEYMYVTGPEVMATAGFLTQEEIQRVRENIKESVKEFGSSYELQTTFKEAEGNPAQTIVDMSPEYSLVIIGSEIEGKIHKRHLGPMARNVVRFAESPVMVVREWQDKRLSNLKNILVPVDGSNVSNFAAAHAGHIAARTGGNVTLLHVWDKKNEKILKKLHKDHMSFSGFRDNMTSGIIEDAESTILDDIQIGKEVIGGDASDVIIEQSEKFDLIVMGTWGKGGIKKFLLGCTAENVAQHANCPVLLVRGIPEY